MLLSRYRVIKNFPVHRIGAYNIFNPIFEYQAEWFIHTFCIGKKNWMFHVSVKEAQASAIIYNSSERVELNNLRPYSNTCLQNSQNSAMMKEIYLLHKLKHLLPWSTELPKKCRKPHRQQSSDMVFSVSVRFDIYVLRSLLFCF